MGDVTRESHRDRMQVLVDGVWVDVANVTEFGIEQTRPIEGASIDDAWFDEAVITPTPTTFSLDVTFAEGEAFGRSMFDLIERAEREARAERARRRLWLRFPYRMP